MNLLRAAEFKVGLMVLMISGLIAYMSMQVSSDPSFMGRTNEAWFVMPDAGGLVKGSSVRSAGIQVGVIKSIELDEDGNAKLWVSLRPDIKLFNSASIEIKSQGILGDKFVSVKPGSSADGPLEAGGRIFNVKDQGSLDSVITQVGDIAGSLKDTAKALKESVTEDGTRSHILGRIVKNIETVTSDLAQVTSQNKDKIGDIVDRVDSITASIDDILNGDGDESLKKQLKRTMTRLDSAMKNIDEISGKINRGEGTIGRLINDEETVEELNTAIDGVNGFLDTAGKTQTSLDFHADYLGNMGLTKSTVGIKLQPGLDRYYYIGIVDDPAGVVEKTDTRLTTGGTTTESTEVKTFHSKTKFNVMFGKNFYNFSIHGGLIESSGGFGVDYYFGYDKWKFTVDAFDFSQLNLRAQLQYNVWKGIYVMGGASDMMNRQGKSTNYVGAGLLLTNDDLKMLMTKLPFN